MAVIEIVGKNERYPILESHKIIIGRSSKCDVPIADTRASRQHCEIGKGEKGYYVRDLESYNGTQLNGKRVTEKTLFHQDEIRIGEVLMRFILAPEERAVYQALGLAPQEETSYSLVIETAAGGQSVYPLRQGVTSLGRGAENTIALSDNLASAQHAEIVWDKGQFYLRDLDSRNGIYLNGRRVKLHGLKHGEKIQLGETMICFVDTTQESLSRPIRLAWPLVIGLTTVLLLFGVLWGMWFYLGRARQGEYIPGNGLRDSSFESGQEWQLQGSMSIVRAQAGRTGPSALRLSSTQPNDPLWQECLYAEPLALTYSKAYRVLAWVRYEGLEGVAGVKVHWTGKGQWLSPSDGYTPLVTGTSAQWQKLEHVFLPPAGAQEMRLSVIVVGRAREVFFDDVQVFEVPGDTAVRWPTLQVAEISISMDERGLLYLNRGLQPIVSLGRLLLWPGQEAASPAPQVPLASQTFAMGKSVKQTPRLTWTGHLRALQQSETMPLTVTCVQENDGFVITCALLEEGPRASSWNLEYLWQGPPMLAGQSVYLPMALRELAASEESIVTSQWLWLFHGQGPLGFILEQPLRCRFQREEGTFSLLAERTNRLSFKLKTNFSEDRLQLQDLRQQVEKKESEGRWGEALTLYTVILRNPAFLPESTDWQTLVERARSLMQQADQTKTDLEARLEQIHFYQGSILEIQKLEESTLDGLPNKFNQLQMLIAQENQKWAGSPLVEFLAGLQKTVESELGKIQTAALQRKATELFQRAQNLEQAGKPGLALLLFQEILRSCAQSAQASQAATKVAQLKEAIGKTKGS